MSDLAMSDLESRIRVLEQKIEALERSMMQITRKNAEYPLRTIEEKISEARDKALRCSQAETDWKERNSGWKERYFIKQIEIRGKKRFVICDKYQNDKIVQDADKWGYKTEEKAEKAKWWFYGGGIAEASRS